MPPRAPETPTIFQSLIYTCQLPGVDSFDYLTELQRRAEELAANPKEWMPWSYRETLTPIKEPQAPKRD